MVVVDVEGRSDVQAELRAVKGSRVDAVTYTLLPIPSLAVQLVNIGGVSVRVGVVVEEEMSRESAPPFTALH